MTIGVKDDQGITRCVRADTCIPHLRSATRNTSRVESDKEFSRLEPKNEPCTCNTLTILVRNDNHNSRQRNRAQLPPAQKTEFPITATVCTEAVLRQLRYLPQCTVLWVETALKATQAHRAQMSASVSPPSLSPARAAYDKPHGSRTPARCGLRDCNWHCNLLKFLSHRVGLVYVLAI